MRRLRVRPRQPGSRGLGRHRPAQLRGSVRQRAGEADERRGEKPCGIRALSECGSFRLQKAVLRSKENAAVERREARRHALWAGSSLPLEGQVRSQDGPTGAAFRAREFRRSASLFIGSAKGSKLTIWHDSPPGCAARQRSRTVQHDAWRKDDVEVCAPHSPRHARA